MSSDAVFLLHDAGGKIVERPHAFVGRNEGACGNEEEGNQETLHGWTVAQYFILHDKQATGLHDLAIVEPDGRLLDETVEVTGDAEPYPPIDLLSPNAMWIVPMTFSSSRMTPVSIARSFVPMPNSATLRASRPCGSSSATSCSASGAAGDVGGIAVLHDDADRL